MNCPGIMIKFWPKNRKLVPILYVLTLSGELSLLAPRKQVQRAKPEAAPQDMYCWTCGMTAGTLPFH